MNIKLLCTVIALTSCALFFYLIYYFGRLQFLPFWNGGIEDKTYITISLIACITAFLIALEQSLTLLITFFVDTFNSSTSTSSVKYIRFIMFPFKGIALFFTMSLSYIV